MGACHLVGAVTVGRGDRGLAAVDLVMALTLSWLVAFSALGVVMAVRGGLAARRLHSAVSAASSQAESQAYLQRCPSTTPVQTGAGETVGFCYSETTVTRGTTQGPVEIRTKVLAHDGTPYSLVSSAAACRMGSNRGQLNLYWATSGGAVAVRAARVTWEEYTNRRLYQIRWWASSGIVSLWYDSVGVPPGTRVDFGQPVLSAHAQFWFSFWPGFGAGQVVPFDIELFRRSGLTESVRVACAVRFQ